MRRPFTAERTLISTSSFRSVVLAGLGLLAGSVSAQDQVIPEDVNPKTTDSGLKYSVLTPGQGGASPAIGDRVKVHYTGWLVDGAVFDSSRKRGQPSVFFLGEVVPGWNEGLQLMTVGARFKFTIPPELGYGPRGNPLSSRA